MLSGEFKHTLDPKNRLFIPAKHREELTADDDSFMITKSVRERCLRVYSMSEWKAYIEPINKMDRRDAEIAYRTLHRESTTANFDSQGRTVLPPSLIEYAEITKGAVIVGCGTYAEIWSEENHEKMVAEENIVALKDLLESYGL